MSPSPHAGNFDPTPATVVSLPEAAEALSISVATLRRTIARGDGPPVVRLSQRRVGIRSGDLRAWLDARLTRTSDNEQ